MCGVTQLFKQSLTSVLNEIESEFEALLATIIRIGYAVMAFIALEAVGHAPYLLSLTFVVGLTREVLIVFLVHDDDMVEAGEVAPRVKLSCYVVDTITALRAMPTHAAVGQLSHVPWSDAG